jgi:hypothetical protein
LFLRSIVLAAITLALALVLFAGPAQAITFGQPDSANTYANTGAIVVRWTDGTWFEACSGSLVHPQVFLTAGHCTEWFESLIASGSIPLSDMKVSFSHTNIFDPATWLDLAAVVTHPEYSGISKSLREADIGALVLAAPVQGITPVTLPPLGMLDQLKRAGMLGHGNEKMRFIAAGYGYMLQWPPPQSSDSDGQRWFSSPEYRALNTAWLSMSQNPATGNAGTCNGDSGGPNFLEYNGLLYQVGITSWGDMPCISTNVVYRTDIPLSQNFIQWVVDGLQ